jgi:hypothetical protein
MNQMNLFQDTLTSSLQDTHVSPSVLPGSEEAKKMTDISGRTFFPLFKKSDLLGPFLRMCMGTSLWASIQCLLTWRVKDTPQGRLLFQLVPLVLPTKEIDSGSSHTQTEELEMFLTPNTMDALPPRSPEALKKQYDKNRKGRTTHSTLREQVIYPEPSQMWPTPTTMDIKAGSESLKHATKMLQGKTHRASGQPIQTTLSDKVMMEEIKKKPELMELYQDHQMEERPYLPKQQEFVEYLRSQTTIKELVAKTDIKKTTIEHWFRKDKAGFSHPSISDWVKIKPHLKTIKFDQEMTTIQNKEWENKTFWPTPTTKGYGHGSEGQYQNLYKKMMQGIITKEELEIMTATKMENHRSYAKMKRLWTTPTARDWKGSTMTPNHPEGFNRSLANDVKLWPTPAAANSKGAVKARFMGSDQYRGNLDEAVRTHKGDGQLNPQWVEWLMGYPEGWTDLED